MLVVLDTNNNPRAGKFPNEMKAVLAGYVRTHNLTLLDVPDHIKIHDGILDKHRFILAYINEDLTDKLMEIKTGIVKTKPVQEEIIKEEKPKSELSPGDVINFIYHGQGRSDIESKMREGPWLVTAVIYNFIGLKKINPDFTVPANSDTVISTKTVLTDKQKIIHKLKPVWS